MLVTGSSANHFIEGRDSIASVQANLPGHKIVFYDLGLKVWQVRQVGHDNFEQRSI